MHTYIFGKSKQIFCLIDIIQRTFLKFGDILPSFDHWEGSTVQYWVELSLPWRQIFVVDHKMWWEHKAEGQTCSHQSVEVSQCIPGLCCVPQMLISQNSCTNKYCNENSKNDL